MSWYPSGLHRAWQPMEVCYTALVGSNPLLSMEWQPLSNSGAPLLTCVKSVFWKKVRVLFWIFFLIIFLLFWVEFPFLYFQWSLLKPESWPNSHVHSELVEICTRKGSGRDKEQQNESKATNEERHKSQTKIERWGCWVPNMSSLEIF